MGIGLLGLLCIGFYLGALLNKPAPIPDGIYLNGKALDLRNMTLDEIRKALPNLRMPALPAQPDRKKKDGALGDVGEVAAISAELTVRNRGSKVDGAGVPIAASIETVALVQGQHDVAGFTNYSAERPGGQWFEKVDRQLCEYTKESFRLSAAESKGGTWRGFIDGEIKAGQLPVLCVYAKLEGYGGNKVAHAVIVTSCRWIEPVGDHVLHYADTNYPGRDFIVWAKELPDDCDVILLSSTKPKPRPIALPQVIEQRGRDKPVEAFGIETLVQVLKELKEAVFGDKKTGTPGLRDDIAKGLGDFYSTLRTGFVVFCGSVIALFGWIAISLHRLADNSNTRVMQMTAIQEIAKAGGS